MYNGRVKFKGALTVLLLWSATMSVSTQNAYDPSGYSRDAVEAITGVAQMIVSDAFHPMTGVETGDTQFVASPVLFEIRKTGREPQVETEGIIGFTVGIGGGYAVGDRTTAYGILTTFRVSGTARIQPFAQEDSSVRSDIGLTHVALLGGIGYEVIDRPRIVVPVFAGPILQYFSASIDSESAPAAFEPALFGLPAGPDVSGTLSANLTGQGVLMGVSGGVAAAVYLGRGFHITPYLIGMATFNRPSIDAAVTATPANSTIPPGTSSRELALDPVYAAMAGIDAGFRTRSGWGVSLALGDLLASFLGFGTTQTAQGIDVRPLVLVVSYSYNAL